MKHILLLSVLFGFTESEVLFSNSILYDQYDIFQPTTTTFVNNLCKEGCSVYASIPPDATDALEEAKKVTIYDFETNITLFDLAALIDPVTTQKKSLDFPAKQRVININYSGDVEAAGPMLLYVFSNTGKSNVPFEVYEARTMKRSISPARIVTVLSPEPFTIGTNPTQLGNTVYSYAAGMENAINYGPDQCVKVFELNDQGSFPGFVLNVQLPILSFFFNMDTPVEFYTRIAYSTVTGFDQFLSTPGFNGCYGMQVYRSSLYKDSLEHTVSGEKLTNVRVDATLNTDEDSPVKITDVTNNKDFDLWGDNAHNNAQQSIAMNSKLLFIKWNKQYTRSSFLLRFATSDIPFTSTTVIPTQPTTSSAYRSENANFFHLLLHLQQSICPDILGVASLLAVLLSLLN